MKSRLRLALGMVAVAGALAIWALRPGAGACSHTAGEQLQALAPLLNASSALIDVLENRQRPPDVDELYLRHVKARAFLVKHPPQEDPDLDAAIREFLESGDELLDRSEIFESQLLNARREIAHPELKSQWDANRPGGRQARRCR